MQNELKRLLRAYVFTLIIIICVFALWAGVREAENNTRRIAFGEVVNTVDINSLFNKS